MRILHDNFVMCTCKADSSTVKLKKKNGNFKKKCLPGTLIGVALNLLICNYVYDIFCII